MELPNYFLADLPDGSTLTPQLIADACHTLKKNRERYLAGQETGKLIVILADWAREWLEPGHVFRELALARGPAATGFSHETLAAGLDRFFRRITVENLEALLAQDLGSARRLDAFAPDGDGARGTAGAMAAMARGPELIAHVTGGVLPDPVFMSMILGLLTRSAQFVKCPSGRALLPRLFAHSLYAVRPKFGACLEVAEWKGGTMPLEKALFLEADCVTATGNDETLRTVRNQARPGARFLGYGHRISFACVARESMTRRGADAAAAQLARDMAAWDQLGCLSPQVAYVERGGNLEPEAFAARLAEELAKREQAEPRGPVPAAVAAAIAARRLFYEVRGANDGSAKVWSSPNSTAWTVVCEADATFQPSCLHRFMQVKEVGDLREILVAADRARPHLSTIGLSAPPARARELAAEWARWGALRVCPLGEMQNPPLTWRHDGRPSLGDLVTWTDIEV